jgi:dephospho-CoA kinase
VSRVILQITGEARAGKSEVCNHLSSEFNFSTILISDIIRGYAKTNGIFLGRRSDYLAAHNRMKEHLGLEIIKDTVLETTSERIVVDGVRVPNDVQRLREVGSQVIALHCPVDVRFERAKRLQTDIDPLTFEDFVHDDKEDAYNPDRERQSTHTVMSEADYHIDSSQPLSAVFRDLDDIVIPILG